MIEEHRLVADRDHVVVKHPVVDRLGILFGEHDTIGAETVAARHRFRGLAGLPALEPSPDGLPPAASGEFQPHATMDEELHAAHAVTLAEPGVVGGALVGECRGAGQRIMDVKPLGVREDPAEQRGRPRGLDRSVVEGGQIRWCELDPPRIGVRGRRDGRGVRGPHAAR